MTQEAAEAEATLQAVLSFLDECELDQAVDLVGQQQQVDALVATQGERPSQKRCAPKRPRGYKANRARDERRFELIHLRETVSSLEKELDDLCSQARKRQSAPKPPRSDEPSSALLVTSSLDCAFSMWEGIASRQLDQRQRAEMENIRLKNFLEQQIKVAKTLQRLIHRRAAWEEILKGNRRQGITRTAVSSNAAEFQDLIEGADQALGNVDSVLRATGLCEVQRRLFSDARVRVGENGGIVLEIIDTKLLPFDLETTGKAVWRHFMHAMQTLPSRVYYPQHIEITDDTVMEQFDLEMESASASAGFHVRQVLRKREAENRILISWRCVMEMISFAGEPTGGILLPEDGYVVLTRSPQGDTTRMQMCYVITPDLFMHDSSRMGTLTDFIIHSVMHTIRASHQIIENFLLDHALQEKLPGECG